MKASMIILALCSACTGAQVQSADNIAIDLTNAVCTLAPDSPVGQPFVTVVCSIAQGVEETVSVVVGETFDGGTAAKAVMSVPVRSITLQIPSPNANRFLDAHARRSSIP